MDLLRKVYDELYSHLSEEFSVADLLKAAQVLIDVTKEEYGSEIYQDGQLHPGYYSFDVHMMITDRQWWLLGVETTAIEAWDDECGSRLSATANIKRYYNPDPYYHRG